VFLCALVRAVESLVVRTNEGAERVGVASEVLLNFEDGYRGKWIE